MENNLRTLYDTFLDSGELTDILPEATGIWEKDKEVFQSIYSNLDTSLLDFSSKDSEDEDDTFIDEDWLYVRS